MKTYDNIQTRVSDTTRLVDSKLVYDVTIDTQGFTAYGLTDLEFARVLSVLKVLDQKKYKEVTK